MTSTHAADMPTIRYVLLQPSPVKPQYGLSGGGRPSDVDQKCDCFSVIIYTCILDVTMNGWMLPSRTASHRIDSMRHSNQPVIPYGMYYLAELYLLHMFADVQPVHPL
jgi:hypothetical protein